MVCGSGVYRLTRWTKCERAGVHQTVLYDPDVERHTTSNLLDYTPTSGRHLPATYVIEMNNITRLIIFTISRD